MRRRVALAIVAASCLVCEVRAAAAGEARFPSHDVRVSVAIGDDGRAIVSEDYALTAPLSAPTFQFLGDTCTAVTSLSAFAGDMAVPFAPANEVRGPWTFLRLDSPRPFGERGSVFRLRYDVSARGSERVFPIMMPASALETAGGARGARVDLVVRWAGPPGTARVAMPRLDPSSTPGTWEAALLAIPSSVHVDMDGAAGVPCDRTSAATSGGLEWRFAIFAGTMIVWVPAYLWWFGRRWQPDT